MTQFIQPKLAILTYFMKSYKNMKSLPNNLISAAFLVATSSAHAADGTWSTDIAGNWSDSTKWASGTIADGTDAIADFSTLNIAGGRTVTVDSNRIVGTLKFGDTGATGDSAWTLASTVGSTLTLATSSGQPVIDLGSTGTAGSFVQHTISATLVGSNGFNITGGNQVVFNTGSLTNVTGTATITSGRMSFQTGADLSSSGLTAIDIKNGGHIGLWNTGTYTQNFTIAGTGYGETNYEAAIRGGNNGNTATISGGVTLSANATVGARLGGTLVLSGGVGESTLGSTLSIGSNTLNGTVVLSGAGSYTGGTSVTSGATLRVDHATALGTGMVTLTGGSTLKLATINNHTYTIANDITLNGGTIYEENAAKNGTGITLSGSITIGTGTNIIKTRYDERPLTLSGGLAGSGNVTITQETGAYQGGLVRLTGAGTFSGTATIQGQSSDSYPVDLLHNQALQSATVNMGTNGRLRISTADATIAGLTGTTGKVFNNGTTARTLTVNNALGNAYGGTIAGTGLSLIKSGNGALTLTGNNSYTGGTTITAGILNAANNTVAQLALGSGDVSINGGALAINDAAVGQLTLGAGADLVMSAGQINIDIASLGSFDTIIGNSSALLNLTGGELALSGFAGFEGSGLVGNTYSIFSGFDVASEITNLNITGYDSTNWVASLDSTTGTLSFTNVPEPSAALLGGIGVLFLLRRRRA